MSRERHSPSAASMHRTFAPSLLIVSMYSSSSTLSKTIPPPDTHESDNQRSNISQGTSLLTGLQVGNAILERHGPDGDTRVQFVLVEIKPPDGAGVHSSALLLQSTDELDGFDLRSTGYSSGREDGSEGVKSRNQAGFSPPYISQTQMTYRVFPSRS